MAKQIKEIIDTNIILRYLVGDNSVQQKKAQNIFKQAQAGKRKLFIKPLVIAEACFVLESFYKKDRNQIADVFEVFLAQKWLQVEDRKTLISLWQYYRQNYHFVDSYLIAWVKTNKANIVSFDKKINKEVG